MKQNLTALIIGAAFGGVLAWAHLSDADVIRDMLLLREAHVFLAMGAAIAVAAIGARVLRTMKFRAPLAGEPIAWDLVRTEKRHVVGSILFGIGWSVAGTCPGPAAVMIGQGRIAGLAVVSGMLVGVLVEGARGKRSRVATRPIVEPARAAGL